MRARAAGVEDAEAKQKIVVELYDKFFGTAFPGLADRLGIVYTPVEIVDFILRSVDELLRSEFGQTLGSEGVHVIEPFAGTGTFITRLLQSGLIQPRDLERKYRHELHANEQVLLAYYIAAINIEASYHALAGGEYLPFEGICLPDTFQLHEGDGDLVGELMADNTTRRARQKKLPIRVIVGNPPYSVGQASANDNSANVTYPALDRRITDIYAARSSATSKRDLYNSYIRALRWASDRVGPKGVIGFVTNGGWVDGNAADGIHLCFAEEFSSIHVVHLRGNQRTSGEQSRREGGKVFGQGSRAPVAITLLVRNPDAADQGVIRFHDIGDYLDREQKMAIVSRHGSIGGIDGAGKWQAITPDPHGDWLNQRDAGFDAFLPLGVKDKATKDLRDRVLACPDLSLAEVAARFSVSPSYVSKVRARLRLLGDASPGPQHNHVPPRLAPLTDAVRDQIAANPDAKLREVRAWLVQAHGVQVSHPVLCKAVARLGLTHKKHLRAAEQDREDVAAARKAWAELQPTLDPSRLVFLDETWATTNMARSHGWAPKGERLVCAVPHGQWHTTTFLCGLRIGGLVRPWCLTARSAGRRSWPMSSSSSHPP